MAIHESIPSMLQESLIEMILVADYCVHFEKDPQKWGAPGCYGYPAALILLSIADSIGSYVLEGSVENHFNILNHNDYYNLGLTEDEIKVIYNKYRNFLSHNSVIAPEAFLDIGDYENDVFEIRDGRPFINLLPFLLLSKKVVKSFLTDAGGIVGSSGTLSNIIKKSCNDQIADG